MKRIKRMVSAVLCAVMLFSMASCSSTDETKRRRDRDDDERTTEASKHEGGDMASNDLGETALPSAIIYDYDPDFTFTTTDRDGNVYDENIFAEAHLTMINFWEPWCGPCVNEMPDLELLYENYKDNGLQIIGVYSESGMESDVDRILKDCGTSYPILKYTSEFAQFDSGYVPTTVFVDGQGHVITMSDGEKYIVGSKDYRSWEITVNRLLSGH